MRKGFFWEIKCSGGIASSLESRTQGLIGVLVCNTGGGEKIFGCILGQGGGKKFIDGGSQCIFIVEDLKYVFGGCGGTRGDK